MEIQGLKSKPELKLGQVKTRLQPTVTTNRQTLPKSGLWVEKLVLNSFDITFMYIYILCTFIVWIWFEVYTFILYWFWIWYCIQLMFMYHITLDCIAFHAISNGWAVSEEPCPKGNAGRELIDCVSCASVSMQNLCIGPTSLPYPNWMLFPSSLPAKEWKTGNRCVEGRVCRPMGGAQGYHVYMFESHCVPTGVARIFVY